MIKVEIWFLVDPKTILCVWKGDACFDSMTSSGSSLNFFFVFR